MAINILDTVITNRLSAGEVVERPASIVKELVDNAIDAKSTQITVEIENGGIDFIKVVDNGSGIEENDLKKAFLPHATSKIKSLEDLDNIFTLGFRGEALASIVSVSQLTMTTKTDNDDIASTISVNGGIFGDIKKVAGSTGTSIEVKNLFFNTPARRKFLRKPKQEENEITDVMTRYILANPTIKFKYIVGGKTVFSSNGNNLFDAISSVYSIDTTHNILPIDSFHNNVHIYGYVSKVAYTKPNTTYQTLLVNGRYVVDETVSKAVYMAYQEFLMHRQFPFYVINIDLPFTDVDVNVHPNKLAIKFAHPSEIFDLIYNSTRKVVYESINPTKNEYTAINSDLPQEIAEVEIESDDEGVIYETPDFDNGKLMFSQSFGENISIFDKYSTTKQAGNVENNAINTTSKTTMSKKSNFDSDKISNRVYEQNTNSDIIVNTQNNDCKRNNFDQFSNDTMQDNRSADYVQSAIADKENYGINATQIDTISSYNPIDNFCEFKIIGEIFSEFIILEYQDKMILMDFHAGHERLLYDKLTKQFAGKEVIVQDLLVPYVQQMSVKEVDYVLQFADEFAKIGFSIDQISQTELRISSVPLLCKDINLKEFVDDLVNDINSYKPTVAYEIDAYLMRTACRSAVKAGQKLNELQIKALLKDLDMKKPVLLCPHGRPVISIVSRSQIEKWFKRIVD